MNSSLKALFERLGPVQAIDRVPSGSAAVVALRPADGLAGLKTVSAALALARRGATMMLARQAMDELIERGRTVVSLPMVEDMGVLGADLAAAGVDATAVAPSAEVDVRALRQRLGLTQEAFALRFGLDLAALRGWEVGEGQPEAAARSYLRVIERAPDVVEGLLSST